MKFKTLLTVVLIGCASQLWAQTSDAVHGQNGYYNYTAQQMQADGVTFPMFSDGQKVEGWHNLDAQFDGDYVKFVMGLNSDTPSAVVYKSGNSTDKTSYTWRVSFKFLPKDTIRITKDYPVVAWKFSLPYNSLSEAKTEMFCEHWINNPLTGKAQVFNNKWGTNTLDESKKNIDWYYDPVKGIRTDGRFYYWTKYPGLANTENTKDVIKDMDWASVADWNSKGLSVNSDYGFIYNNLDSKTNIKDKSMEFIRLPKSAEEKAEFIVLINYGVIEDIEEGKGQTKNAFLDVYDHLGIPRQHFNFSCQADKTNENGQDKSNDEKPVVYLKWMKTFKSIDDAEAAICESNNWGDGTTSEITLSETSDYKNVPAATYGKVMLDRPLKAGKWNTFCVPFNMKTSTLGKVMQLTSVTTDGTNTTLNFTTAASIEAGKPYIVMPESDIESIEVGNVALSAATPTPLTVDGVTMTGCYENMYLPVGSYYISGNKFYFVDQADAVKTKSYRAYITLNSASSAKQLLINADGHTTSIAEAFADDAIDATNSIYSISGQRIAKDASSLSSLPHGIYIVGGKKIIK